MASEHGVVGVLSGKIESALRRRARFKVRPNFDAPNFAAGKSARVLLASS